MQKPGNDDVGIETHFEQHFRDLYGMDDVRFAGQPVLIFMGQNCILEGLFHPGYVSSLKTADVYEIFQLGYGFLRHMLLERIDFNLF